MATTPSASTDQSHQKHQEQQQDAQHIILQKTKVTSAVSYRNMILINGSNKLQAEAVMKDLQEGFHDLAKVYTVCSLHHKETPVHRITFPTVTLEVFILPKQTRRFLEEWKKWRTRQILTLESGAGQKGSCIHLFFFFIFRL